MKKGFLSAHRRTVASTFSVAAMLVAPAAFAQEGWTTLATQDGVTASAQIQECDGASYFVVRLENTNGSAQTVGYTLTLADAPVIPPISDTKEVAAGASVEGECGNTANTLTIATLENADSLDKLSVTLTVSE
ncbi:MAG: hypothetical protein H6585_05300 [Flavobacteriales bacterium]|nr:hypothetical protein [Flavobacteriales bacterium]MCB9447745.1 hypothetical protein [Flavobacteriales bacterium]